MAKTINGVKISYDYGDMLVELLEELDDEVLNSDSEIYVFRKNNEKNKEYVPIIDWCYVEDLEETINEQLNNDCIYEKKLLNDVLYEMFQLHTII